jgi:hypothetical protein
MLLAFDAFDDRIAVAIDDDIEYKRAATYRTILNEMLAPTAGRIDADRVLLTARRTAVENVEVERH